MLAPQEPCDFVPLAAVSRTGPVTPPTACSCTRLRYVPCGIDHRGPLPWVLASALRRDPLTGRCFLSELSSSEYTEAGAADNAAEAAPEPGGSAAELSTAEAGDGGPAEAAPGAADGAELDGAGAETSVAAATEERELEPGEAGPAEPDTPTGGMPAKTDASGEDTQPQDTTAEATDPGPADTGTSDSASTSDTEGVEPGSEGPADQDQALAEPGDQGLPPSEPAEARGEPSRAGPVAEAGEGEPLTAADETYAEGADSGVTERDAVEPGAMEPGESEPAAVDAGARGTEAGDEAGLEAEDADSVDGEPEQPDGEGGEAAQGGPDGIGVEPADDTDETEPIDDAAGTGGADDSLGNLDDADRAAASPEKQPLLPYTLTDWGGLNFLPSDDMAGANAAKNEGIPGYTDVIIHGTPETFVLPHSDETFSPQQMANIIRVSPDYDGGPVRLVSCSSGALPEGAAQQVANSLNQPVIAASDTVWPLPDGRLIVGRSLRNPSGEWRTFNPQKGR